MITCGPAVQAELGGSNARVIGKGIVVGEGKEACERHVFQGQYELLILIGCFEDEALRHLKIGNVIELLFLAVRAGGHEVGDIANHKFKLFSFGW